MREASDREALWHALRSGVIDMIATDHAPHTAEVKTRLPIWRADCGFPGVERQMPLMLTEVARGRLAIEHYCQDRRGSAGEGVRLVADPRARWRRGRMRTSRSSTRIGPR
ncbi:MAG: hypothetical protein RML45_12600 [Acetobacteraceae bacterium]|nr:hypothetical protein [Acetobacteraceae bacterium]